MNSQTKAVYFSLVKHPGDSLTAQAIRLGLAKETVRQAHVQLVESGLAEPDESPAMQIRAATYEDAITELVARAVVEGAFEYLADDPACDAWLSTARSRARIEIITAGMRVPGGGYKDTPPLGAGGVDPERGLRLRVLFPKVLLTQDVAMQGMQLLQGSGIEVRLSDQVQTFAAVVDGSMALVQADAESHESYFAVTSPDVAADLRAVVEAQWRQAVPLALVAATSAVRPWRAARQKVRESDAALLMRAFTAMSI